jgi:hypothetical protein
VNTLKEWIEHYDFINEARWGDDDKESPTWEEVRNEHLSDWNGPGDMSWEYWDAYVTGMIIEYARDEVRRCQE